MDILSFSAGYALGYAGRNRTGTHPDSLTYTDSDQQYVPPTPLTGETFDTITETYTALQIQRVWGIGVTDKGGSNETVTRLVYPDKSYCMLTNF